MNIYLARSPEVDPVFYQDIVSLLKTFQGPINFLGLESESENDAEIDRPNGFDPADDYKKLYESENFESHGVTWQYLFDECEDIRRQGRVESNDYVVLLTDRPNKRNWFTCFDENNPRNIFVHTADWKRFIHCDRRYPAAYEAATEPFKAMIIQRHENFRQSTHATAIGCMMDLCGTKTDIQLKLRTGDICEECMERLNAAGADPAEVEHLISILDGIRVQMLFRSRQLRETTISRLKVTRHYQIELSDYGQRIVRLSPLPRALYIFYLRHPEGVAFSDLCDYQGEIAEIYAKFSTADTREIINANIARLVNPLDNSLNEKVSRIKKTFTDALGPRLAEHYIISGPPAGKRSIQLDRNLITYEPWYFNGTTQQR